MVIVGENRSFDHIFATYKPKPGHFGKHTVEHGKSSHYGNGH
jgi:phospholipase C